MAPSTYEVIVRGRSFELGASRASTYFTDSADEEQIRGSEYLTAALLRDGFVESERRSVDLGLRWQPELFEARGRAVDDAHVQIIYEHLSGAVIWPITSSIPHWTSVETTRANIVRLASYLGIDSMVESDNAAPRLGLADEPLYSVIDHVGVSAADHRCLRLTNLAFSCALPR